MSKQIIKPVNSARSFSTSSSSKALTTTNFSLSCTCCKRSILHKISDYQMLNFYHLKNKTNFVIYICESSKCQDKIGYMLESDPGIVGCLNCHNVVTQSSFSIVTSFETLPGLEHKIVTCSEACYDIMYSEYSTLKLNYKCHACKKITKKFVECCLRTGQNGKQSGKQVRDERCKGITYCSEECRNKDPCQRNLD